MDLIYSFSITNNIDITQICLEYGKGDNPSYHANTTGKITVSHDKYSSKINCGGLTFFKTNKYSLVLSDTNNFRTVQIEEPQATLKKLWENLVYYQSNIQLLF